MQVLIVSHLNLQKLLGFMLTLAVLYLFPIAEQSAPLIALLCLLFTLLIFQYAYAIALLKRRAFLNEVFKEKSPLKQTLWRSALTQLFYVVVSLMLSITLLLLVSLFDTIDWLVILAMVLGYFFIDNIQRKKLHNQIKAQHHLGVTHRFTFVSIFAIQAILLTGFQLLYGTHTDVMDTTFTELFQHHFNQFSTEKHPIIGFALSWVHTVNDAVWYVATLLTHTKTSDSAKWAMMIGLVLYNAIKVAMVWYALLGVSMLIEKQHQRHWRILGKDTFTQSFVVTILTLAIATTLIYGLGTQQNGFIHNQTSSNASNRERCTEPQQQIINTLFNGLETELVQGIPPINESIQQAFANNLNASFSSLEHRVDDYLDWHFSVTGEYARLLALSKNASGLWGEANHLNRLINDKMTHFYGEKLQGILSFQLQKADTLLTNELGTLLTTELEKFRFKVQQDSCLRMEEKNGALNPIFNSDPMAGAGSMAGLSAVAAAKLANQAMAKKTIGSIAAKLAVKSTAKTAAKAATASSAASAGTACGPFTLVCGTALGVGTWIGVDLAASKVDEKLNREELKAEIMASLQAQQEQLIADFNNHLQSETSQWPSRTMKELKQIRHQTLLP